METLYIIIILIFYIIGTFISFNKKINGDQSKVSQFEAKYPLLTSLNPLGQPSFILIIMGVFIYLFLNT